jgi:hypothetical protein
VCAGLAIMHSVRTHRRLKVWCLWCQRDDGPDDPQTAPEPDPVGTAHA